MSLGKKLMTFAVIAAMAVFAAGSAFAAIVNSDHDMIFKNTLTGAARKSGACSFCHIPHKAGGDKLWASTYSSGTGWQAETISQLCYTCHGAGTTYGAALEVNPFGSSGKHGRTVATLTGFGDIAALPSDVPVSAGDANLKCTSCHDVHANENRPFIRYMGAVGTFDFGAHCEKCHARRANVIGQGTANIVPAGTNFSQHPTDQAIADTLKGKANPMQATIAAEFGVVGGVQGIGTGSWNLGGHRTDNLATGNMNCATCHAVHGNESAVFSSAADGGTPVASEQANPNPHLEVLSPSPTTVSAVICTGCHVNVQTGTLSGPGAANTYSHPIDTASNTWTMAGIDTAALTSSVGSKWGTSSGNAVIVCQSCHDMHYATVGSSLLRGTLDAPATTSNKNCDVCHGATSLANHHPANVTYPAACVSSPVTHSTAFNWTTYAFGTAAPAYVLTAGKITCGTCHGGASGAHNNPTGFPGLSGNNVCSTMCVDCHTTNPSACTAVVGAGTQGTGITPQASHFVGSIASTGYKRTAVWGTTNLASQYCNVSANGEIICESCHTLKTNKWLAMGVSSNTAVSGVVRASVGLLLENAGNNTAVYNTSNTGTVKDMCTGCHGASPTGGTASGAGTATHPTISMGMATAASAGIQTKIGTVAAGTVSLIPTTNLVNCESCHRPHDAAGGSGALILEATGTASTKLAGGAAGVIFDRATGNSGANYAEEATFCNFCHSY